MPFHDNDEFADDNDAGDGDDEMVMKPACLHRCWDEPFQPLRPHSSPADARAVTRQPCSASRWQPRATTRHTPLPEHCHEVMSPLSPKRTPRTASAWCTTHSVPSFMASCSAWRHYKQGPVHTIHPTVKGTLIIH